MKIAIQTIIEKKTYFILLVFIILVFFTDSCNSSVKKISKTDGEQSDNKIEITPNEDFLIIGGQRVGIYDDYYRNSDIEKIRDLILRQINPGNTENRTSLEGIEQLINLQGLRLKGRNLDMLDLSPLKSLEKLESITFESEDTGKLTKVPDFSGMASQDSITWIKFENCALTSMDNIEFLPNLRYLDFAGPDLAGYVGPVDGLKAINRLRHLKDLKMYSENGFRVKGITSLRSLWRLDIRSSFIDLEGIEELGSLEILLLGEGCEARNTAYLVRHKGLRVLFLNIQDAVPDIQFIGGIENLFILSISAAEGTWGGQTIMPYQVLDLSPLGNLTNLADLELRGFILRNIDALDGLNNLREANVVNSIFDSGEPRCTKKKFIFSYDAR
jgi:Leucine-rich repeat (LRR) protein